jgi:hypothetical protein
VKPDVEASNETGSDDKDCGRGEEASGNGDEDFSNDDEDPVLHTSATPAEHSSSSVIQTSATPTQHSSDPVATTSATPAQHAPGPVGTMTSPVNSPRIDTTSCRVMELQDKFFSGQQIPADPSLFVQVAKFIEGLPRSEIEQATKEDQQGFIQFLQRAWSATFEYSDDDDDVECKDADSLTIDNALMHFLEEGGKCSLMSYPGMPTYLAYSGDDDDDYSPAAGTKHAEVVHMNAGAETILEEEVNQQHATSPAELSHIANKGSITYIYVKLSENSQNWKIHKPR